MPVPAVGLADLAAPRIDGLSICIPVLNEQAAIAETLRRCLEAVPAIKASGIPEVEVIVVDDGSTDGTAGIVRSFPEVRLVQHPQNRGYGAALKTGFANARFELIGFLDADATYPPEHFPRLCESVVRDHAHLVIGSRLAGADTEMPIVRRIGNTFFAKLLTLVGRTIVTDSASGMRVFRRGTLDLLSPLPDGLNLTPVMSTRAVHEGIKVVEVAIPYKERVGESKLSVTRDGMRFLSTILWTVLAYNPVRLFGLVGLGGVSVALAVGVGLVVARLQGVTELGPLGTYAVFAALVSGVAG
jgi:glycosyltransferase involved in cell wall biosynthesis